MIDQLLKLLEFGTAGSPMGGLKWTRRSLAKLAKELQKSGVTVSKTTIGKWLSAHNYSLRVNSKCISRLSPAGRNQQFERIKHLIEYCRIHNIPTICVDTKKKELIGWFINAGGILCKIPIKVNDHDFPSQAKAIPYGVYEPLAHRGCVYVGDSSDTPEFAVDSITQWFKTEGKKHYPNAKRLVILADCGGSNSYRARAWKYFLQKTLCDPYQIQITVAHFPSGSSKWNPIEHRMFSAISRNWQGRPLDSWETLLNYIQSTIDKSGLSIKAVRMRKSYQTGIKITDQQMKEIKIVRNKTLPNWNYDIYPSEPNT